MGISSHVQMCYYHPTRWTPVLQWFIFHLCIKTEKQRMKWKTLVLLNRVGRGGAFLSELPGINGFSLRKWCVCYCTVCLFDYSLIPYEPINHIELDCLKDRVFVNAMEAGGWIKRGEYPNGFFHRGQYWQISGCLCSLCHQPTVQAAQV